MKDLSALAAQVLQHQRSTSDLIAEALREAISQGMFQDGEPLRQDQIAQQFGVSRIPVREALRQLESEGLITFQAHRGAMVTPLTAAEAQEIYEIRTALECLALDLAFAQLTQADLQQAKGILMEVEASGDVGIWSQANWRFHAQLYVPAQRPRLLSLIRTLYIRVDRYLRLRMEEIEYHHRSHREHQVLLQFCQQGERQAAIDQLRDHIQSAGQDLVQYLKAKASPVALD